MEVVAEVAQHTMRSVAASRHALPKAARASGMDHATSSCDRGGLFGSDGCFAAPKDTSIIILKRHLEKWHILKISPNPRCMKRYVY